MTDSMAPVLTAVIAAIMPASITASREAVLKILRLITLKDLMAAYYERFGCYSCH